MKIENGYVKLNIEISRGVHIREGLIFAKVEPKIWRETESQPEHIILTGKNVNMKLREVEIIY